MFVLSVIIFVSSMILAFSGGWLLGLSLAGDDSYTTIALILLIIAFTLMIAVQFIPVKDLKKNRSEFKIVTDKTPDEIENILTSFLKQNKFKLGRYNDEDVYKNGAGLLTARKFIKYYIDGNTIIIYAWVTMIGIGWTPHKDLPLDNGLFAAFPKKQLRKKIEKLYEEF